MLPILPVTDKHYNVIKKRKRMLNVKSERKFKFNSEKKEENLKSVFLKFYDSSKSAEISSNGDQRA